MTVPNIVDSVYSVDMADYHRIASLLEQEARIELELAQEFRTNAVQSQGDPIRPLNLGRLQQAIFDLLLTADESGLSPREIAKHLSRGDEPNIRSALSRMRERGVTDLVAGSVTQRWQLTVSYRAS